MTASDHLSPHQFVSTMRPSEMLRYADQTKREGAGASYIAELGQSIQRRGYRPSEHGGMSGDTHSYPPSFPIEMHWDNGDNTLWNGNHRVLAMNDIGYDKPVPVLHKIWPAREEIGAG